MSEADSLAYCEAAFAEDLQGHPLLSNRSTWFRYSIVKNAHWYFDNVVLLGDALRTGHPSIGSGTRLAMQDAIALFAACQSAGNVAGALAEFRRIRRPGSDSLQQAAIKSTQWYENLGPKLHLDPISFAYDYLRRTGRVDHEDVKRRDPGLAAAYEALSVTKSCRPASRAHDLSRDSQHERLRAAARFSCRNGTKRVDHMALRARSVTRACGSTACDPC
jgi:hypothetical protein